MDGDGHNAKAFAWAKFDEDEGDAAPAFDPASVLRAIDDEDADDAPAPPPRATADLGAALRAAMTWEGAQDEDDAIEATGEAHPDEDALACDDAGDGLHAGTVEAEAWETAEADAPDQAEDEDEDEDEEDGDFPAPALHAFPPIDALDGPGRKPRIALMGEFSAGKSTLSNLLIGAAPLPMKVTATQLPPVWISFGEGAPYREDLDGDTHAVDIARLSEIDPAETRAIRIFEKSEVLEMCDIIDMPGISDPNMESDVWERVIGKADAVIWCTHATQAWRQTEASVWESLDPRLHDRSILLVTRWDKIHGESDRARVLRRVERETEGLFAARLPVSLTDALAAGEDEELLARSGAAALRDMLVEIIGRLAAEIGTDDGGRRERTAETLARDGMVPRMAGGRPTRPIAPSRILPRRVRPVSEAMPARQHPGDNTAEL
jgi:GTP-binding protein EngB required for normal cell division